MKKSNNLAQIREKLYQLLSPLTPEERARIVQSTLILFGDQETPIVGTGGGNLNPAQPSQQLGSEQEYFQTKNPKNKGEELAVAARYREEKQRAETHSKADLKKVITDARRNFDDKNFGRDLNNAKRQAGFFNTGTARNASKLSYYGQQFVDALPNRDAAAKIKRPTVKRARKGKKSN